MFKVVTKRFLNEAKTICLFEIEAPLVARHAQMVFASFRNLLVTTLNIFYYLLSI